MWAPQIIEGWQGSQGSLGTSREEGCGGGSSEGDTAEVASVRRLKGCAGVQGGSGWWVCWRERGDCRHCNHSGQSSRTSLLEHQCDDVAMQSGRTIARTQGAMVSDNYSCRKGNWGKIIRTQLGEMQCNVIIRRHKRVSDGWQSLMPKQWFLPGMMSMSRAIPPKTKVKNQHPLNFSTWFHSAYPSSSSHLPPNDPQIASHLSSRLFFWAPPWNSAHIAAHSLSCAKLQQSRMQKLESLHRVQCSLFNRIIFWMPHFCLKSQTYIYLYSILPVVIAL